MQNRDSLLFLALCRAGFLRPRERIRLAVAIESAGALEALGRREVEELLGRRIRSHDVCTRELVDRASGDERRLTRDGIGCIFYFDSGYPKALRDIYDPPLVLFYRGAGLREQVRVVAVVGTRKPAQRASLAARELGWTLARAGVSVVSGLARGIDGEAHRGAVGAGGRHVAVLGCGLARILPVSNAAVGRRILATGGTLVSELPPDEPPRKQHFPARNRLISGLSEAVVVVQAPARSGALITADFALEQGKELMVHADGLGGYLGAGGDALAESGALVVRSGADVLRAIGLQAGSGRECEGGRSIGERIALALERELEGP